MIKTGKVIDVMTDEPLLGASVTIVNKDGVPTGTGTLTNNEGIFYINSPLLDDLYNKVVFSYVGYNDLKLSPSAVTDTIYMGKKDSLLSEVVIIGHIKNKRVKEITIFVLSVIITALLITYITKYMKKL